ncbi:unnamed protein product [Schistosoma spindalis]|nr:unnamed protein product [Schistosoma spindale]
MYVDSRFEFHTFLNFINAPFVLPFLVFTSPSDLPCSSIMLSRYVKRSTSSRVSSSSVIKFVFFVLYLRMLLFVLCILWLTDSEDAATLIIFICISSCV